jgi:hypothetical protein
LRWLLQDWWPLLIRAAPIVLMIVFALLLGLMASNLVGVWPEEWHNRWDYPNDELPIKADRIEDVFVPPSSGGVNDPKRHDERMLAVWKEWMWEGYDMRKMQPIADGQLYHPMEFERYLVIRQQGAFPTWYKTFNVEVCMIPTAWVRAGAAFLVRDSVTAERAGLPTLRQRLVSIPFEIKEGYEGEKGPVIIRLENPNKDEQLLFILKVVGKRRPNFKLFKEFFPFLSERYQLPADADKFNIHLRKACTE